MHTILMIAGGMVMLGLFLLFGVLWGGPKPDLGFAAKLFVPVWLVVTLINMWVGVARAGYPLRDELPVLLVVFVVPALLAASVVWWYVREGAR